MIEKITATSAAPTEKLQTFTAIGKHGEIWAYIQGDFEVYCKEMGFKFYSKKLPCLHKSMLNGIEYHHKNLFDGSYSSIDLSIYFHNMIKEEEEIPIIMTNSVLQANRTWKRLGYIAVFLANHVRHDSSGGLRLRLKTRVCHLI